VEGNAAVVLCIKSEKSEDICGFAFSPTEIPTSCFGCFGMPAERQCLPENVSAKDLKLFRKEPFRETEFPMQRAPFFVRMDSGNEPFPRNIRR